MIRAALGVRNNCPNLIILIESGCLPLSYLIKSRQLKFFRRFKLSLQQNSVRSAIFQQLTIERSKFLEYYIDLDTRFIDTKILKSEIMDQDIYQRIRGLGSDIENHYKYWIYLQMNKNLTKSPFLNRIDLIGKYMMKFRTGSHNLKIETGRWSRTPRVNRLCPNCLEFGDEFHAVYTCRLIVRDDLSDIPLEMSLIWDYPGINLLFKRLNIAGLVD